MHEAEIAERFIQAAGVDMRLPKDSGPRQVRSLALPYIHDFADVNGYGDGMQLAHGEAKPRNRLKELSEVFFDARSLRVTSAEVSDLEECIAWVGKYLIDEGQRRALWAWAFARAGGRSFRVWCKAEGIHPNTGKDRKNRALQRISDHLAGKRDLHDENREIRLLHTPHEISDVSATLAEEAGNRNHLNSWMSDTAFAPFMDGEPQSAFAWAQKRNERRRQREKRKAA